jgi:hypothetical protein
MRRPIIISIIIPVVAPVISAQELFPDVIIYAAGGFSKPLEPGDFSNLWGTAGNCGLALGYQPYRGFVLKAFFEFHRFPEDEAEIEAKAIRENVILSGGSEPADIYHFGFALKVDVFRDMKRFGPYINVGLGRSQQRADPVYASSGDAVWPYVRPVDSENVDTFSLGAGFEFRLNSRLYLFTESKYAIAFASGKNTIFLPFQIGIALPSRVFEF